MEEIASLGQVHPGAAVAWHVGLGKSLDNSALNITIVII